jgi:hypothetical protein
MGADFRSAHGHNLLMVGRASPLQCAKRCRIFLQFRGYATIAGGADVPPEKSMPRSYNKSAFLVKNMVGYCLFDALFGVGNFYSSQLRDYRRRGVYYSFKGKFTLGTRFALMLLSAKLEGDLCRVSIQSKMLRAGPA